MAGLIGKINSSNSNQTAAKLNKQISFTNEQIELLCKLQLLNKEPLDCVSLVSSALKLDNVEDNNVHFWLSDTLAAIVRSIQRSHINVSQGIIVVHWIIYFMNLIIEEKLSKRELFENLHECVKVALTNSDGLMILLPNHIEYPKYPSSVVQIGKNSSIKTRPSNILSAEQMATFIINTIHKNFWDDFKYTVIQLTFEIEPIQAKRRETSVRDISPVYEKNNAINHEEKNYNCHPIMDRYFLRTFEDPLFSTDSTYTRTK